MENFTVSEVISRIIYFRSLRRLSARELSLMIGKNAAYINHLESKEFNITLPVLFEIIEALEISCAEFFAENYTGYKEDKEILDLLKGLPTERKKAFIEILKNLK